MARTMQTANRADNILNVDMEEIEVDSDMEADMSVNINPNINGGIGVDDNEEVGASVDPNAATQGTVFLQDHEIKQEEAVQNVEPPNAAVPPNTATTAVDGQGMWRAWTRVFEKPESACLDLLDNCLDATLHANFHGKVVMKVLTSYQATGNTDANSNIMQYPNGICIMNNSKEPIQNLQDALTVYKSAKNAAFAEAATAAAAPPLNTQMKQAIGENGVGLKHGCATLCDTSFVLTRNGTSVQVGVIAKSLQSDQGVFLPSFILDCASGETEDNFATIADVRRLIENALETLPKAVAQVVAKDLGRGHLRVGIRQLAHQVNAMWLDDEGDEYWKKEHHVFQVVLCNLHHNITTGSSGNEVIDVDNPTPYVSPARSFLRTIQELLPEYYINIPSSEDEFDFYIDGERAAFSYWQHRLVELTHFKVNIPLDKPIEQYPDSSNWVKEGYLLNIYCGFDAQCLEKDNQTDACRMFVYSRQAGRLISRVEDARHLLGVPASGSDYRQGLTIIIDDRGSQLPLMPTKDGIAWSEQKGGDVHKHNLYAWVGGVVHCYWNETFKKFDTKQKGGNGKDLMKRTINSFAAEQRLLAAAGAGADMDQDTESRGDMASAEFTRWTFRWKKQVLKHDGKLSIRRLTRGGVIEDGRDTLFHIIPERVQQVLDQVRAAAQSRALKNPARNTRKKAPPPAAAALPAETEAAAAAAAEVNDGVRAGRKRDVDYLDIDSSDGEEPSIAYNPPNRKRAAVKRGASRQENGDNSSISSSSNNNNVDEQKMLQMELNLQEVQLRLQEAQTQLTKEKLARVTAEKALKTEQKRAGKEQTKATKSVEKKLRSELNKVKAERDSLKNQLGARREEEEELERLTEENKQLKESLEEKDELEEEASTLRKKIGKLQHRLDRRNERIGKLEKLVKLEAPPAERPPSSDGRTPAVTPRKLHYAAGEIQSI